MTAVVVHMPLLDEGTDCWRPVQAEHLHDDLYRIIGHAPNDECWQFATGDVVRCRRATLRNGGPHECLVAFEKTSDT